MTAHTTPTPADRRRRARWLVAVQVLLLVVVLTQLSLVWLPLGRSDPTRPLRGWSAWAAGFPLEEADAVLSDRYQRASELWLLSGLPAASLTQRLDEFVVVGHPLRDVLDRLG